MFSLLVSIAGERELTFDRNNAKAHSESGGVASVEVTFLTSMQITSISLDAVENLVRQGRLKLPFDLRKLGDLSVMHPLEVIPV